MCGIAGILNLTSENPLSQPIRRMTDALAHRGPNADGFHVEDKTIALGHRRLSIIDLSTSANQPFHDPAGRYTLIFNGEIYNYQDIKPLLSDWTFKTSSDTEVLLAAYATWGKNCLQHLNGMFAFAIWDKIEQKLFIARDRLGVKPLYYHLDTQQFSFSSEIRSLLSTGFVAKELDKNAVRDYLTFQSVYAPKTLLRGVFQLMPGEYAEISRKTGLHKGLYWQVGVPHNGIAFPDAKTVQKNVYDLLSASIERRMMSDVPLGAFLSGGIDSSAVVALMAQATERPIDTFTVSFAEKEFDESRFAHIISKKYNTRHNTIHLSPDDFLKELPDALEAVDAPSGDGLNTYVVSKATKKAGVTVALSGLGGDELFAGYQYFPHFQKLNTQLSAYWHLPKTVRHPFVWLAQKALSNNAKTERALNILDLPAPTLSAVYPHFRLINTEGGANALLNDSNFEEWTISKLLNERQTGIEKLPLLSQVTAGELLGYTLNVLLRDTDQFSMASALEVREPFFDYKLVEYVVKVPDHFKYDKATPKSLLVKSMGDLLPDEIVHRPKYGFVFPWRRWLLNELRPLCEKYLDLLGTYSLFNKTAIQQLWAQFQSDNSMSYVKIWQLVVLSHWLQKNEIVKLRD